MGNRKRDITIKVNGGAPKRCRRYAFGYARTKDIGLFVGPRSATVTMRLGTEKGPSEFGGAENPYFVNALQKAMIAVLLTYGRFIVAELIEVSIDSDSRVVYSLEGGHAPLMLSPTSFAGAIDLAPEWRRADVMENVLGMPKTKAGNRVAAVAALAISKTKKGAVSAVEQSECLTYLWMAMNGYYNTLRKLALAHISDRKEYNKLKNSEAKAIELCLRFHGLGDRVPEKKHAPMMARRAIRALQGIDSIFDELDEDSERRLEEFGRWLNGFSVEGNDGEVFPYASLSLPGYLTLCLPYYFRCDIFHADRPLPVFVTKHDERFWCIGLLCDTVESFLDGELWHLFDNEYLTGFAIPRLWDIVDGNC